MIYLILGVIGLAVFSKGTIIEFLEIVTAIIWIFLDKTWNLIFG